MTATRAALFTLLAVSVLCATNVVRAAEPKTPPPVVRDAWARATPPGAGVAAVYLTIVGGAQPDRLVAATTPRAAMTQIHTATEADGMARMRPVASVDVPAGQRVDLAPQGLHLMLMNLTQPLVAGERFALDLSFERSGKVAVQVAVRAPGVAPPTQH